MEREWLAAELEAGRSIEAIARTTGRAASTVADWVNKYGLASQLAAKHASRGGIERDVLVALVDEGLSVREIAASQQLSPTTVRHWLRKFGLGTRRAAFRRNAELGRSSANVPAMAGPCGFDRRPGGCGASVADSKP